MATLTKEQYEALKRQGRGTYRGQTSSSGQFIIEADKFVGDLQGNADTATRLRDPITISLGGDAEGSAQFAGSSFRLDATIREAEHSVNADVAENANHSAQASHADLANIATLALRSMLADNASHAEEASHADDSTHADSSDVSTLATRALHADDAYHADEADNATYALKDSNGDNIHNTFVDKQSQITTNTNNIATHEGTLTNHEGRISQAESNISSLDTRVGDIETSTDVGRITQRIVNIEAKDVEQDGRLDAINDTMVTLSTAQYILSPKTFNAGSKTVMDNEAGATEITNKGYVDNKVLSSANYVTDNLESYTDNKVLSASRYMTDYVDNRVLSTSQYVDDNFMSLTKSQYVTGLNTFEQLPRSEATPTNDNDFVTKKYLEDNQPSGLLTGQNIQSSIPLVDARLHEKDGALIQGDGIYSDFVNMMGDLYRSNKLKAYSSFIVSSDFEAGYVAYVKDDVLSANTVIYDCQGNVTDQFSLVYDSYYEGYVIRPVGGIWTTLTRDTERDIVVDSDIFVKPNVAFHSPILASNVASEGSSFAVVDSSTANYTTMWQMFDGNLNTGFLSNATKDIYFTAYNPEPFVLTKVRVYNKLLSATASAVSVLMVYGVKTVDGTETQTLLGVGHKPSDVEDGSWWEFDIAPTNTAYQKYYFRTHNHSRKGKPEYSIGEMQLEGYYPKDAETTYQEIVAKYGSCDRFVYDPVNNTLRLPKDNTEHGALIKSYKNGSDWYRIYQDGWCEQGTIIGGGSTYNATLIHQFKDLNYQVYACYNTDTTGTSGGVAVAVNKKTISSFELKNGGGTYSWYACGYCDISDLQSTPIYEYIVLGTTAKTEHQIDIDNIATDLNGKADTDLSNVTTPAQTFKNEVMKWGQPDYTAGVELDINTESTFDAYWYGFYGNSTYISWTIILPNGNTITLASTSASGLSGSAWQFIPKGSKYTYAYGNHKPILYPLKGAN